MALIPGISCISGDRACFPNRMWDCSGPALFSYKTGLSDYFPNMTGKISSRTFHRDGIRTGNQNHLFPDHWKVFHISMLNPVTSGARRDFQISDLMFVITGFSSQWLEMI